MKIRKKHIELEIKDTETIYIRNKHSDYFIKLDIIDFCILDNIIKEAKEQHMEKLKHMLDDKIKELGKLHY